MSRGLEKLWGSSRKIDNDERIEPLLEKKTTKKELIEKKRIRRRREREGGKEWCWKRTKTKKRNLIRKRRRGKATKR